ncbi:MAG: PAS domain S-box protein [Clostridiales bacterium]|nr:PAS domain S-box protein [Clostridiales bacterium]MCF8023312.1 PAS domain S-box protein [Clostridiales bacterium]
MISGDREQKVMKELYCLRKENAELRAKLRQKENKNENLLQEQGCFFKTLIDTIPDPIFYKDMNGLYQGCNRAFAEKIGFSEEQLLGKSIYDLFPQKLADIYKEKELQFLKTSSVQVDETAFPFTDGTMHDVVIHKGAYKNSEGEIAGIVGVIVDINERKQMEKALRESKELYQQLVELSPDLIGVHDFNGKLLFCNHAAAKILGCKSVDELIGRNAIDFVHPNYIKLVKDKIKHMQKTNNQILFFEQTLLMLNGTCIDVETAGIPISFSGYPAVLVIAKNITQRKRYQELLEKERRKLFLILDQLPAVVYIQAKDRSIRFANRMFINKFGEPEKGKTCYETILGKKEPCEHCKTLNVFNTKEPQEWEWSNNDGKTYQIFNYPFYDINNYLLVLVLGIDVTKRKQAELALKESEILYRTIFENTGTATFLFKRDNKISLVNTEFELLSGYSKEDIEGKKKCLDFVIGEDKELLLEYHSKRFNDPDKAPRKYETRFVDRHGNIKNIMVTVSVIPETQNRVASLQDITEIRRFQQEMIRLEQLNLAAQMAAGIGHEIRNPMTTVRGMLQLYKEKEELTKYKENIDLMIDELDRANTIITQFLSLAKDKPVEKKNTSLNTIITTIFPLINANAFRYNMQIKLELGDISDLLLDDQEIKQLILNLVQNGLEEMEEGNTLTIRTFAKNEEVVLAVSDQGKGIKPEVFDKLGTSFLTTKDEGTGLGLAICYSIAARHNAVISVKTSSEGSTFFVKFKLTN